MLAALVQGHCHIKKCCSVLRKPQREELSQLQRHARRATHPDCTDVLFGDRQGERVGKRVSA
jgi:hypothetical protein